MASLHDFLASSYQREHVSLLGRASIALLPILDFLAREGFSKKIALPSFLCPSPLAAICEAEWEPYFCDVSLVDGNVSSFEIDKAVAAGVNVFFLVHLFGNPNSATARLLEIQKTKKIFVIEDACQALGAWHNGKPCGTFGDVSLFSFGHTKTIDVKGGGAALTDELLLKEYIDSFDFKNSSLLRIPTDVSGYFYAAQKAFFADPDHSPAHFSGLVDIYRQSLGRSWNESWVDPILERLGHLEKVVALRREKQQLYREGLQGIVPLEWSENASPWRYAFRVPGLSWDQQRQLSEAVRAVGTNLSNWYYPTHWMYGTHGSHLEWTSQFSREIFQLWLDDDTDFEMVNQNIKTFNEAYQRFHG